MIDVRVQPSPRYIPLALASLYERTKIKKKIEINVKLVFCPVSHFSPWTIASRIRYEITSGNIGGAFAVKNMTGAIYVAGALDYETRKRVSTKVRFLVCNETSSRGNGFCSFFWR